MKTFRTRTLLGGGLAAALLGTALAAAGPAAANHPVFVEGNCLGPGMGAEATGLQTSPVAAGSCGDYDGDGSIGDAEDADGDNSFGTINGALSAVGQNGRVTIVASGIFPETVVLNPTEGGNVTLEAAPGVDANVDAVVQGDAGSADRQGQPGIVIDGCSSCRVTVRNIMSRNWTDGVQVRGDSHATLDQVRVENNLNYGLHFLDRARVAVSESDVNASGFRKGASGVGTPNPGIGISVEDRSKASVYDTSVTGSFGAGIFADRQRDVRLDDVQVFDNNPNYLFERGRPRR